MQRKALADKVLVLGVDGLDPHLTKKYVDMGIMPNVKKLMEKGSRRPQLDMIGGHPTITPPMWATLSTGCYANVHGIDDFYIKGDTIADIAYAIDSRVIKAEQLWNCFAEAGKKTLVWHWPGCSWPPLNDDPNLMIVDGTAPGSVCSAGCQVDAEYLAAASESVEKVTFVHAGATEAHAACVVEDLPESDVKQQEMAGETSDGVAVSMSAGIVWKAEQRMLTFTDVPLDLSQSSIKPATGWTNAPADAKEFTVLFSGGLIRRPALILKNKDGIYDHVALYKSKKDAEPIVELPLNEMVYDIVDEAIKNDQKYRCNRNMRLLSLDPEGKNLNIYISAAMDMDNDAFFHPKKLFKDIQENIGCLQPNSMIGCQDRVLIEDCMLANWDGSEAFQANSILYLIEHEGVECVFSHLHNVDLQMHMFIKYIGKEKGRKHEAAYYEHMAEEVYKQTDRYVGRFLHLLDEGWAIFLVSDHGQVATKHDVPYVAEGQALSTPLMEQIGYTVLKRDENGNKIGEIDWEKTRAILSHSGHIYLNIKGRDPHGIVDPADQYEVEEDIMTKLYELKDPETGHRIISVALRNKDCVLLGEGGPTAGDIYCWVAEGYNFDHCDSLGTFEGEYDTCVSPIFIAAGPGIKENYETDRYIRQIDFAAMVAAVGGVRFPAQCEGAPVYQIFTEEF